MLKTYYSLENSLIDAYSKHDEHHNYLIKLSATLFGLVVNAGEVCL